MNTKALASLAALICAAQEQDRTPMGIAFAIDAAGRHMSPEVAAEMARLSARVAELEAERHVTNEALSDAAECMRADRDRIAELEALKPAPIQTCRVCGAGYTLGEPCSTCAFRERMAAEAGRPSAEWFAGAVSPRPVDHRSWEDPHDSPLYSPRRIPHDLDWPETGGQR